MTPPKRMRTLAKDGRGYPIPFIVLIDKSGKPQFTINDQAKVEIAARKKLCAICGKRLEAMAWFVGGSRCFIHEHGAFVDPPLHLECAEYALQTCPFLAAPRYLKRIDAKKMRPEDRPDGMSLVEVPFMGPAQPERFGLGGTRAWQRQLTDYQGPIFVVTSWDYVEWWRNGARVNAPEAVVPDAAMVAGEVL